MLCAHATSFSRHTLQRKNRDSIFEERKRAEIFIAIPFKSKRSKKENKIE